MGEIATSCDSYDRSKQFTCAAMRIYIRLCYNLLFKDVHRFLTQIYNSVHDFRIPLRRKRNIRSSRMFFRVDW